MDEGIQTSGSDVHHENADSPRIESRQPPSNVNCERLRQRSKQDFGIASIDGGMQIDRSDEQEANEDSPRVKTVHRTSKVTRASPLQSLKQPPEML
jgi:hypothetical protein